MPYTPDHKVRTREKIVEAASGLFNLHGFERVSIDEIMAGAGLTRGGFYNHFATKDELYAEVVARVLRQGRPNCGRAAADANPARAFIGAYLSREHYAKRESSCPLAALPSDVAHGGEPVRRAYRQVLEYMIDNLEKGLSGPDPRTRAMSIAALCIGAMAVARAVDDAELAQGVRRAAKQLALSLTRWHEPRVEAAE